MDSELKKAAEKWKEIQARGAGQPSTSARAPVPSGPRPKPTQAIKSLYDVLGSPPAEIRRPSIEHGPRVAASVDSGSPSRPPSRGPAPPPLSAHVPQTVTAHRLPAVSAAGLEAEVFGGALWFDSCRATSARFPDKIPDEFESLEHYQASFMPLLYEEAREGIKNDVGERCEGGGGSQCEITDASPSDRGEGWWRIVLRDPGARAQGSWGPVLSRANIREKSTVVLFSERPPRSQALSWIRRSLGLPPEHRFSQAPGPNKPEPRDTNKRKHEVAKAPVSELEELYALSPKTKQFRPTPPTSPPAAPTPTDEELELQALYCLSPKKPKPAVVKPEPEPEPTSVPLPPKLAEKQQAPPPSENGGLATAAALKAKAPARPFFLIAGLVREVGPRGELVIEAKALCAAHRACGGECCTAHAMLEAAFPPRELLAPKADSDKAREGETPPLQLDLKKRTLWAVAAGPLVVAQREYAALKGMGRIPPLAEILRPSRLRGTGSGAWPQDCTSLPFHEFLRSTFDGPQLEAIEESCGFLGEPAGPSSAQSARAFKLIQGPPGTGKTHTVCGVLNVWHLVQYVRHYRSLEALLTSPTAADRILGGVSWADLQVIGQPAMGSEAQTNLVEAIHQLLNDARGRKDERTRPPAAAPGVLELPPLQPKPRILVAAPSNAAVDELLGRIMSEGFMDLDGARYFPHCLRVGSTEANLDQRARLVLVETMLDEWLGMDGPTFEYRTADWQTRMAHACEALVAQLQSLRAGTSHKNASKEIVKVYGEVEKCWCELQRLGIIRSKFMPSNRFDFKGARKDLELSFIDEAQLVFSTLSSCGRPLLLEGKCVFENVLIDEACQACETATLQPLVFGCRNCVMVGDPQQLPATVLSRLGKEHLLDRSLFERMMAAGCPVRMLTVQYRMHPYIRQFPSDHFYGGKLADGESIKALAPEPYYAHDFLKPYVFFDVTEGREQRQGNFSLRNTEEALVALSLYFELQSFLSLRDGEGPTGASASAPPSVGIITPYRQQRAHIEDVFRQALGEEELSRVKIETIDSFQGKQLDVVIMSCVRSRQDPESDVTTVGFVADVRRMNVAITRARRALWILGNAATLRASPTWSALLDDAAGRGLLIEDVSLAQHFSQHEALHALCRAGAGPRPPRGRPMPPVDHGEPPAHMQAIGPAGMGQGLHAQQQPYPGRGPHPPQHI